MSGRTLFAALLFHTVDFLSRLRVIDKLSTFSPPVAFVDVRRNRAAFFVGPTLLSVLRLKGLAHDVFGIGVCAAGEAFVDRRFKDRAGRSVAWRLSASFFIAA